MEVVSEGGEERDYVVKGEEYLAYGILEYWILDPLARCVVILIRDGDAWVETVHRDGEVVTSLILPGFAVPVLSLWEDLDENQVEGS
jgi:Uma2 family endonuclease